MIKMLFKIQLQAVYKTIIMRTGERKKKKNPIISLVFILLIVYVLATLMISAGATFYQLAVAYIPMGLGWVYFANVGLMGLGMGVMLSVFMSQSLLFEAKDNELLLSLPIKPSHILGSRLIVLGAVNYVASMLYLLPGGVIYVMIAKPSAMFYLFYLIAILILPLLGLAIAALFGFIISFVTAKMRNKSLFVIVFSLLLLGGYMWAYVGMTTGATNLVTNGASIGEAIRKSMPPFYYFGLSIQNSDLLALLVFAIWAIVPAALMYFLLSKAFIKLATTKHQAKKVIYHEGTAAVQTVYSALLKKEIGKFLNTPIYLLNCGIGFLLAVALGVYCLIAGPNMLRMLTVNAPEMVEIIIPIVIALLSFTAATSITTSPSISLEGNRIWILKSSPVRVQDIFKAKIMMNIIFGVCSLLIADISLIYLLKPNFIQAMLIVTIPIAVQVFSAIQGLMCNLYFPKLDFTNEAMVVKNSASVLVSMLVSFGAVMSMVLLYFALNSVMSYEMIGVFVLAVIVALCAFAYKLVFGKGIMMFNRL